MNATTAANPRGTPSTAPADSPDSIAESRWRFRRRHERLVASVVRRHRKRFHSPATPAITAALERWPRSLFCPSATVERAFDDSACPAFGGSNLSQPSLVAQMLEHVAPRPRHRVLEVGGGSGYQAALLSELVAEVWSVEVDAALAADTGARLAALGISTVHVVAGDGAYGCPEHAPFDGIIVACAIPGIYPALVRDLAPDGRIVAPVCVDPARPDRGQRLVIGMRDEHGEFVSRCFGDVIFQPIRTDIPPPRATSCAGA